MILLIKMSQLKMLQFKLLPQDGTIALGQQSAFQTFDLAFSVLICCLLSGIIKSLQNSCFHPLENKKSKIFNSVDFKCYHMHNTQHFQIFLPEVSITIISEISKSTLKHSLTGICIICIISVK